MTPTGPRRLALLRSGIVAAATVLALAASTLPTMAAPAEGDILAAGGPTAVAGSYIVVLRDSAVRATAVDTTARDLTAQQGGGVGPVYRHALRGFEARLSERGARRLAAHPAVASVTQNHTMSVAGVQSPTPSWGLDRIDQRALPLDNSFTYPRVSPGVRAYIIDSGINLTHTEFAGRAVSGWDFIDNDADATDCQGHGTHVAGTVGGTTYGVAKNVQLVAVRVFNCDGRGTTSNVLAGVDWVTGDHDPGQLAVANMSLGGPPYAPMVDAVRRSIADGVSYVVAAGNESGADACSYTPASVPEAITVAATDATDARATFSNIGTCVDLFAPGVDITSAYIGSNTATRTASGTSMATPHATGAAALILADNPTYTPAQVTQALLADTTPGVVTNPGVGSPNRLLHVSATTPANDFALTATPASGTVTVGGTISTTITATVTSGAAQPVSLVARGLPDGATATFQPASVSSNGSTTLTINTASTTMAGDYTITVIGTGTGATRATAFQLHLNDPAGCVGSNGTDTPITQGDSPLVPITITDCPGAAARNSTIELHIDHSGIGDLDIRLLSPDGTWYYLLDRTGGDSDDIDYTFTHDLSSETANGTWMLWLNDLLHSGTGFLDSWRINLAGADLPAPACGGRTTTNLRIPAAGTVESSISVAECGLAPSTKSYIEPNIRHQYGRDLRVSLVAPDGQAILLKDAYVGSYRANVRETFITDLSSKPTAGTWKLRVENVADYEGVFEGWKLTLDGGTTPTPTTPPPTTPPPTTPPPTTPPPTTPPPTTPPPTTPPPTTPPPTTPPPTTPPPGGSPACTAVYSVQDQWNGGFVVNVNVTAGAIPLTGWRVTLNLPGGASVTSLWNGVNSGTSGTITVANQSYNGRLAAGQTTNFGFQGTGNGNGATVTCTGSLN
ncbi:S8 family serine peptidase [Micromonospora sp. NPDC047467]|uniref:S8 family serine peptidase n=1 Tax=Micromonospora sp. NPDC047467 TaxID=3154814 RepID=UPI0033F2AD3C